MPSPLHYTSLLLATTFLFFGINAVLRPLHALTFFSLSSTPTISPDDLSLISAITVVYGARDIFIACAIYAAAIFGRGKSGDKVLGWILIAAAAQAGADGAVCRWMVGEGEWAHWGYAPVVAGVGGLLVLR
ncbi:hypothetical protein BCR34DRAFT_666020 [Clohesyomyces aquaticus]|uniref:Integral membrane protein n=1 Tax=Clohesyomyces aquaticus TaxID=1231657 RepID=A0A1Y1ZE64_9PLEO|nr:hypothetical protein BCR34DRAFT_666020 [Clohesyomyces aquaticus]